MRLDFCAGCGCRDDLKQYRFVPRTKGGGGRDDNDFITVCTSCHARRQRALKPKRGRKKGPIFWTRRRYILLAEMFNELAYDFVDDGNHNIESMFKRNKLSVVEIARRIAEEPAFSEYRQGNGRDQLRKRIYEACRQLDAWLDEQLEEAMRFEREYPEEYEEMLAEEGKLIPGGE
jgi:hypothetical protein